MKIKSESFIALMYRFSQADTGRQFNFSSGHLGALPISANEMADILTRQGSIASYKLHYLLLLELLKFLVFLVLPIKYFAIVLRTLGRRLAKKPSLIPNAMTVLSLGGGAAGNDAYFGTLLKTLQEEFNYIKIVGGNQLRSDGFQYIEGALRLGTLAKLLIKTPVYPLIFIFNLLSMSRCGLESKERMLFITLGLRDINAGAPLNNKIIIEAFTDHINSASVRKVLYPMEGRNWEKRIVREMNENNIHSFGYLHCALTPRHLSLLDSRFSRSVELPSVIVAPGAMAYNILSKNYPLKKVIKGYFLRGDKMPPQQLERNSSQLLFALTANIQESIEIINYAALLQKEKDYEVIIRLNPNSASYPYLCEYSKNVGLKLFDKNIVALPGVCFFRSSSVALDYLKLDVLPIYIDMQEVISNNVFDLDNQYGFASVSLNGKFNDAVDVIIKKSLVMPILDGSAAAGYYLDQSYKVDDLPMLLNHECIKDRNDD